MRQRFGAAAARVVLMTVLALPVTLADAQNAPQDANPQTVPAPSPPEAAPQPRDNPGLIQEIGRWFERGAATVFDNKKPADTPAPNAAATNSKSIGETAIDIGKTATDAVVKPLTTRIVSGRERCTAAPNGAPDCVSAAQALCQRHGYTSGKSLDFTQAEQCSPQVYLAGRENAPVCTTITFISRAMCQ